MKTRYHKSIRYRYWQGFTGEWFWQADIPANRIIDGKGKTKEDVIKAAKAMIQSCTR